ncbi:MAG TPA: metal-dependent hydrolase [Cyclobacteriaceae bacterium]
MFIGHFALGFASKKLAKPLSLGTSFLAVQFLDLLWPFFLIFGWETVEIDPGNTAYTPLNFISYPISHSLLTSLGWGILFGLVFYLVKREKGHAILLGFLVVSHWVLDFMTHRPDLPLTPWGSMKVGMELWKSIPATIVVESLLFIAGVYIYLTSTKPRGLKSWLVIMGLVFFLIIISIVNITSPPPPSAEMIGYAGFAQWLLVFWGYWIDKQRFEEN